MTVPAAGAVSDSLFFACKPLSENAYSSQSQNSPARISISVETIFSLARPCTRVAPVDLVDLGVRALAIIAVE